MVVLLSALGRNGTPGSPFDTVNEKLLESFVRYAVGVVPQQEREAAAGT